MTTSRHPRRLCTILIVAIALAVCVAGRVTAGANPDFRIVLHAKQSSFEPCNGYLPVNCINVPPTVNLSTPVGPTAVFVLLFNHTAASGIQTAFEWPGWGFTFSVWDCQLVCDFAPCQEPFGPNAGLVAGDFIGGCLTSPALAVLGRMHFVPAGNPGCISQFVPDEPNGIHLRDCSGGVDLITDASSPRLGKICVGTGGVNACDGAVPVESTTWGQIKATY